MPTDAYRCDVYTHITNNYHRHISNTMHFIEYRIGFVL